MEWIPCDVPQKSSISWILLIQRNIFFIMTFLCSPTVHFRLNCPIKMGSALPEIKQQRHVDVPLVVTYSCDVVWHSFFGNLPLNWWCCCYPRSISAAKWPKWSDRITRKLHDYIPQKTTRRSDAVCHATDTFKRRKNQ